MKEEFILLVQAALMTWSNTSTIARPRQMIFRHILDNKKTLSIAPGRAIVHLQQ
jgi:hypothetical protein